jgi:predicted DsbA family dithiol-disulfide isomerase
MKVEIWSDVACPFCWIGKHHFEEAVKQSGLNNIDVEWKSFELDPYAKKKYDDDLYTLLAKKYGQTREWAINSSDSMTQKGKEIGLEFNFEQTVSTNTFDAHRLIHLAKSLGKQNEAEEALFQAYFRDGKHIGDPEILTKIGMQIGMEEKDIKLMLSSDQYADEVRADESLAQEFRISGVPFFVINRQYGISGAQPISHFVDVLQKAQSEETELTLEQTAEGDSCGIDVCE